MPRVKVPASEAGVAGRILKVCSDTLSPQGLSHMCYRKLVGCLRQVVQQLDSIPPSKTGRGRSRAGSVVLSEL